MKNGVSRPWQGTIVGVLNAIGIAIGILVFAGLLLGGSMISQLLESSEFSILAGIGASIIAFILLPFLILGLFVTSGLFKGKMWTVILSLIFTGFGVVSNIITFNIVGLLINAFFLYSLVICMKHPFYKNS